MSKAVKATSFTFEYAKRALKNIEGLKTTEGWRIEQRVERELHQEIVGDESWSEIEDLVDEILESEGIEDDDSE
jgi:hypothetical protein